MSAVSRAFSDFCAFGRAKMCLSVIRYAVEVEEGSEAVTCQGEGCSQAETRRIPREAHAGNRPLRGSTVAKLGSNKRPAVVRVQTQKRAEELLAICTQHGWQVIVGVEPDQPENIADVERLLKPAGPVQAAPTVGRNAPCPCGSGLKYKRCCGTG